MQREGVLLLLAAIHTAADRSIAWQEQHAAPSSRMTATLVQPGLGSAWHGTAPTDWSLTHSSTSAMQEGEVTHRLSLVSSQSLTLTSLRHGGKKKKHTETLYAEQGSQQHRCPTLQS